MYTHINCVEAVYAFFKTTLNIEVYEALTVQPNLYD